MSSLKKQKKRESMQRKEPQSPVNYAEQLNS